MKHTLALILAALLFVPATRAQPAALLGPDLEPRPVTLRSLSRDKVAITDAQGNDQSLSADEVLRLTFGESASPRIADGNAVATLRDGQVVIGELVASGDDEAIRLSLGAGGAVDLSLDELLSIRLAQDVSVPKVEEDDVLLLATGETLVGFVETIDRASVGFVVGDADDAIPIPLERVKAITLANKPEPPEPAPGLVKASLIDGSTLLLANAKIESQTLIGTSRLGESATKLSLPVGRVAQIEMLSGKHRLSPLLDQPMELIAGGEVFGVAMPPELRDDGLHLHAPTTLAFELPRGATRVTLTAALNLGADVPEARRSLAGCELVVYDGDEAVGGATLSADRGAQTITLPVTGRSLRVELKPGVNGPVLDRVRLFAAEVLVGE